MATMTEQKTQSSNSYDAIPYASFPYIQTKPAHLKTIAQLFGINAPKLETAKVLELGCASGQNLIPHALRYPKAQFVGVDFSQKHIDAAKALVKKLGLKNIEFKQLEIENIGTSLGKFDYVICHNVLSFVTDEVAQAIFELCNNSLTDNGLAYVSYNTLPGWNMVRTVREMMRYHARSFEGSAEQTVQGALLLDFLKSGLEDYTSPYSQMLKNEAELLSDQPISYLHHSYLENENTQYYFHEFMNLASKAGLQYVGDASLASMYVGNLPQVFSSKLQEIKEIERMEQYMDFITNRRFRSTILCRKNVAMTRDITNATIENFYFNMVVAAEKALDAKAVASNVTLNFFCNNNPADILSTDSPVMKAAIYYFSENIRSWNNVAEIAAEVKKTLGSKAPADKQITEELLNNFLFLTMSGRMNCLADKPQIITKLSEKPALSKLTQAELELYNGMWVTNELHEKITLTELDRVLMPLIDGNHTQEQMVDKMVEHVKNKVINIAKGDNPLTDPAEIRQNMENFVSNALAAYLRTATLVK